MGRTWLLVSGAIAAVGLANSPAAIAMDAAQNYPSRPIRFICPYNPGGAGDIFTRVVGQKMSEILGQPVVVDNRAGANGGIGTALVAKANPDGYTLVMGNSGPMTVNPNLYKNVPYDSAKDFTPISQGTVYWYVLVVPPSTPVKSLDDMIGLLKAKPGQLTYGSTGIGGGNHLAGELFNLMTKTTAIHVPYTGSAPALAALLGAQTTYMFDTVVTATPHVKGGKLRAIGQTARKRAGSLPEVPTLDELGLQGFEITQWQAVAGPAGIPKPIVGKLHKAVVQALNSPEVVERIGPKAGNDIVGNTPEEFAQVIRHDLEKYAKLVKEAKIEPR
ncbi:MAG: tripartite tricarboxylate transporter substrate binding protein [Betaproteobacteria bacterium]|nr:tripartite tricarboxylate transporter substrate binding protein [Betaproteobacteria bacterium]